MRRWQDGVRTDWLVDRQQSRMFFMSCWKAILRNDWLRDRRPVRFRIIAVLVVVDVVRNWSLTG